MRQINGLNVGDIVHCVDEKKADELSDVQTRKILNVFVHEVDEMLDIWIEDERIRTTTKHRFFVHQQGWKAASDLAIGDCVVTKDCVRRCVRNKEHYKARTVVFNLAIQEHHNFFVGTSSALVHNMSINSSGHYSK